MSTEHPNFPHGTRKGYRYCKCEQCKEANNAYKLTLNAKYREPPAAKERQRVLNRDYKQTEAGRARRRAHHATRKALMRGAESSKAERELIVAIYRACPKGYEVDHIVPLAKGGAHRAANLQYLPAAVNNAKRARLDFKDSDAALRWQDLLAEPSTTIP